MGGPAARKLNMDWINTFLTLIILINLLLVVVASFGHKSEEERGLVYKVYLFNIATIIWWLASTILFRIANTAKIFLYTKNMYVSATFIASSFYYFSHIFPGYHHAHRAKLTRALCANIIVVALVLFSGAIVKGAVVGAHTGNAYSENAAVFGPYFFIYALYILYYLGGSFMRLFQKYDREADIVTKAQLLYLFVGYSVSGLIAFVADLFLPLIGHFEYLWIGPAATVFVASLTTYAVKRYRLFSIKIIAMEFIVFALWAVAIIRISFYGGASMENPFIDALYLALIIFLGALLIVSLKKEAHQNEKNKELLTELQLANEKLKEVDDLRIKFLSLATHHMASPLTAMKFYASTIKEDIPRGKDRGVIGRIADNFMAVVRDFLDMSKIEAGQTEYRKDPINITETFSRLIKNCREKYNNDKVQFVLETHAGPILALGDEEKLILAMNNIIENCVKYYSKDERTKVMCDEVKIHVLEYGPDREEVNIKIIDCAPRLLPNVPDALLEKFSNTSNKDEANIIGNGIGVYVAKKLIEGQGGRFSILSNGISDTFADGCCFDIYLQRSNL